MHSSGWVALLRHVPEEQQNQLMLVTAAGTEIAMQCILRIDHEFMAIKGRLAGSQEAGRVFFIPFSQIDYLGFAGEVKESAFHEMFGDLVVPAPPQAPGNGSDAPAAFANEEGNEEARSAGEGPPKPGSGPRPAIRSEVLERYRNSRPASSANLPNGLSSSSLQRPRHPEEG